MKKRIALALILLGLSSQAFAVATFGAVSLTVDASRFYFDVVVQDADPGDFNVFRISSEACAIGCPDKERIEFNFNGTDGSFTYGPEVQTFDSPTYDRWQDGVITDLSLVNIGGFDWRVSGSVAHGADPYVSGDTVSQLALRTTSDRYLNDVAITQVVPEVLAFSPSPADFGDVVVGKAGGPIIVTVTNTDAFDEVSFLPWWSDGVLPPFFVAPEIDLPAGMAPCEAEVEPGDACGFAVRFVPTATGPAQQTLQFLSLDEVPVVLGSVDLQGNGIELITEYTVGGTVSGLTGTLTLQNNGGDDLDVSADGSFAFATALSDGSAYAVTILAQPAGQTCEVTNGSGTISGADVTTVVVDCMTPPPPPPPAAPEYVDVPTLDRLGMAVLVVLLLGVGLIGLRRTV